MTERKLTEAEMMMEVAWAESEKSECLKKKVGAILTVRPKDDMGLIILGYGYGGWIHKCETCVRKIHEWQQDGCWSIHSEVRAIFNALEACGYRTFEKGLMFTTAGPCDQCLKYMAFFKIPRVIYSVPYHNDYTKWNGIIEVCRLNEDGSISLENAPLGG